MKKNSKKLLSIILSMAMTFAGLPTVGTGINVYADNETPAVSDYGIMPSDSVVSDSMVYKAEVEKTITDKAYAQSYEDSGLSKDLIVSVSSPDGISEGDKTIIADREKFIVDVNVDNIENTYGLNNYTIFIKYNPNVVELTGLYEPDSTDGYIKYTNDDGDTHTLYVPGKFAEQITYMPPANDPDYADVMPSGEEGTLTTSELGKVKYAYFISDADADNNLLYAKQSGKLMSLEFSVIGSGDTDITVEGTFAYITAKYNPVIQPLKLTVNNGSSGEDTTEATTENPEEINSGLKGHFVLDFNTLYNQYPDGLCDMDVLSDGMSIFDLGASFPVKDSLTLKFSDGLELTGAYQIGNGNASVPADVKIGDNIGDCSDDWSSSFPLEKAIRIDAGSSGKVTFYAAIGSSGKTEVPHILVNKNGDVVWKNILVKTDDLVYDPVVVDIPEAGTYYFLQPGKVSSTNVARIVVNMPYDPDYAPAFTSTSEYTTEASSESIESSTGYSYEAGLRGHFVLDFDTLYKQYPDGLADMDVPYNGIRIFNMGASFPVKDSSTLKFSDDSVLTGAYQIGNGNASVSSDVKTGDNIGDCSDSMSSNIPFEKAIEINAASSGTLTIYAGIGSSGKTEVPYILVDQNGDIVWDYTLIKRDTLIYDPIVVNIPKSGIYYFLQPGKVSSTNVAKIVIDMDDVPSSEPSGQSNELIVSVSSPDTVNKDGKNIISGKEKFVVDVNIDNIENTYGLNNYTIFIKYDPKVVKLTDIYDPDTTDGYINYTDIYSNTHTLFERKYFMGQIDYMPSADDFDYEDVMPAGKEGTLTTAELGKVKYAYYVSDADEDHCLLYAKQSGKLMSLEFSVIGSGETDITIEGSYGFISGSVAGSYDAVVQPLKLTVGNVSDESTTEATTESTVKTTAETTTESTTENTVKTTTETTTEFTTESTVKTTAETTTESTTESTVKTTAETTTESTTETTTESTTDIIEGKCGDSVRFKFYVVIGVLEISGTGSIYDYIAPFLSDIKFYEESAPWNEFGDRVKKVVIDNGVTSTGKNSFSGLTQLEEVVLPETIIELEESSFENCISLEKINIPKNTVNIGTDTFKNCPKLVIETPKASIAEQYAKENNISYEMLIKYGDANNDSKLDASDASLILQKVLKNTFTVQLEKDTPDYEKYLDVDNNQGIEAADAAMVLQKVLKSTYILPAEAQ